MFNLKHRWIDWILVQFKKHYVIGGHCGICGCWVGDAIVNKDWQVTLCPECQSPNKPRTDDE